MNFDFPAGHRVKIKENEKRKKILILCQRTKKAVEHEGDSDTIYSWCAWNSS